MIPLSLVAIYLVFLVVMNVVLCIMNLSFLSIKRIWFDMAITLWLEGMNKEIVKVQYYGKHNSYLIIFLSISIISYIILLT